MKKWDGKTRGGLTGYKIFIFFISNFGISSAYFLLVFVAGYFVLFTKKKYIFFYFNEILGYSILKSIISIYKLYFRFGQVLIDKIALFSASEKRFTYISTGEEYLKDIKNGCILVNAHIGNWEIAGQFLTNIKNKVNVLMFDGEYQRIKNYLELVATERNYSIIPITDDYSHLKLIDSALKNNEIICMHADRFIHSAGYEEFEFLGRKAKFPSGPFYMALKYQVPICFVFTVKISRYEYFFSSTVPQIIEKQNNIKDRKKAIQAIMHEYIHELEKVVKQYPHQWFNFFDFWGIDDHD